MGLADFSDDAFELLSAIEERCESRASLIQTVPVRARIAGTETWDVDVHVFTVADCSKTRTAYAWQSDSRVYTALDIGPVRSPTDAVCAALADRLRERNLARGAH